MTGIFILKNYPNAKPISNLNFNSFSNLFNPISNQYNTQIDTQIDTQINTQIDNRLLLNKHTLNVNVFINNNIYKDKDKDTYNNIYYIKYNIYNTILCGVKNRKVKKPG